MKKALTSITVLFYFVVSCGVVINLHYCMGSFQSFELYSVNSGSCGKCGMPMEESNDCCKNEVKIIILQDEQNKVNLFFELRGIESASVRPSEFIVASIFNVNDLLPHNAHSPPLITGQDTYLQNCVFRI